MDLQEISWQFIQLNFKNYQFQLSQLPKKILMQFFKETSNVSKVTGDCLARFKDVEDIKENLEMLHQVLTIQKTLDESFEEFLAVCFDKSILEFIVAKAMDVKVLEKMGKLHQVDLSKCFIDHKTDIGKRIMAFAPRPLQLDDKKAKLKLLSKSKGPKINNGKPIMDVNGCIEKVVIWKSNGKIRGLQAFTSDRAQFQTEKFALIGNPNDAWQVIQVPRGQWLSNAKVTMSPDQDYVSDLELFTVSGDRADYDANDDGGKYALNKSMIKGNYPLTGIQAQVRHEEDGNPLVTGIKFTFGYYEPKQEYLCSMIGLDANKCIHAESDMNLCRQMDEFHRKLRRLELEVYQNRTHRAAI